MTQTFFYIIIAFIVFDFVFQLVLDYLNTTKWSDELPEELSSFYDAEKYKKSQDYLRTKFKFGLIISILSFLAIISMVVFGGFGYIDNWVQEMTTHPILQALIFFGVLGLASDLLSTPFSIYSTFVIEEKFGFNKTTVKTFILDKIKAWLLMAIIGGGLLALIVWIYMQTGSTFWIWVWLVLAVFSIFMTMFYSSLIVPLFNKQEPLEDGELRSKIEEFALKVGFKLNNIFTIDGSKRSTKSNAYFTGLGAKKRIVLYDTLIENHTDDELVAVLAHEVGHYKKKHIISGLIISLLNSAFMLFILSLFIEKDSQIAADLSSALGASGFSFHIGILAFGILYGPLSFIIGTFMNMLSRKNEYEADRFAGDNFDAESLKKALINLSVDNLSNLRPHPAYVFFHYSHPTLLQRIAALFDD